jgi:hypothetical protein
MQYEREEGYNRILWHATDSFDSTLLIGDEHQVLYFLGVRYIDTWACVSFDSISDEDLKSEEELIQGNLYHNL